MADAAHLVRTQIQRSDDNWPFTHRVFGWLGSAGRAAVSRWRDLAGLALITVVIIGCVVLGRNHSAAVPTVCLAMCTAAWGAQTWLTSTGQPPPLGATVQPDGLYNVAIVDLSHGGRQRARIH